MHLRTLALPALAATVVLSLTACDPTNPAAQPAGPSAAATLAAPGPADETPAGLSTVTLVTPAAPSSPAASATAATPSHTAKPSAKPSPSGSPSAATNAPALKLAEYDKQSGKAVLAAVTESGKGTPSPSASAAATAAVQTGQLIDSPPTAAAPHGALLAITDVKPAGNGKVEVSTRPATISELLGDTWAKVRTALDPHNIKVTPQLKGLKASYVPRADGADGGASAALVLTADDSVPLPSGAKATLNGSLEIDPSVDFSYQGGLLQLQQAKVGFDLGAHADWHITAGLTGSTGPVKFPIANLSATPTIMVGGVPVVIVLNLTVYAEVSADGTVTVDTTQTIDGSWAFHADYTKAGGWTSATDPVSTKVSPVKASFAGNANVRAGLVADGSVALYDTLGVKATVEPYLRAAVEGSAKIDSSAGKPVVTGKAGLYGGLDVNGAVLARIAILGTPLLEKDLPFKIYQNEWPILTASYSNATPSAAPTN